MIARIRRSLRERGEGGFTLIELLVVIIIIGVLAAIAIPSFLNQRRKGWRAAVQSELRNAAAAQESYFTETFSYASTTAQLNVEGYNDDLDVPLVIIVDNTAGAQKWCMSAFHRDDGAADSGYKMLSGGGVPTKTAVACTSATG